MTTATRKIVCQHKLRILVLQKNEYQHRLTESQQGHSWTTPMHLLLIILRVDQVKSNINATTNGWVLPHCLRQLESFRSSVYRIVWRNKETVKDNKLQEGAKVS
jgi:hypothetical protein